MDSHGILLGHLSTSWSNHLFSAANPLLSGGPRVLEKVPLAVTASTPNYVSAPRRIIVPREGGSSLDTTSKGRHRSSGGGKKEQGGFFIGFICFTLNQQREEAVSVAYEPRRHLLGASLGVAVVG